MSFPDSQYLTQWVKFSNNTEIVFVGRDTLAFGAGCHICFYSLILNTKSIYSANRPHLGDGVDCYTGHRLIPILAFAEKCLNPNIIFLSYPHMEQIQIIKGGAPEGYMTLAFTDHEYFITLSSLPEFEIVVWNWRTGQKLASEKTKDHSSNQLLSVSFNYPISVVQYAVNAKKIILWNIHNAYKECILIKKEIYLPYNDYIIEATWNPEGAFFILNKIGCIYMLHSDYKLRIIIYGVIIGTCIPCFAWYKGGFIIMQPSTQIKHFKKYEEWSEDWEVEPMKLKKLIPSYGKECLIGWTYNAEIMELLGGQTEFVLKKNFHSDVSDFQFVYPVCNYFVTLTQDGLSLNLFELTSGKQMDSTPLESKISIISANPIYPYIAAGLVSGLLVLMSYYNAEAPKILTKFRLYREKITRIEFNEQGNLICTAQMQEGLFFIIRGEPGQTMEIISYIDYKRPAIDIVIMEDEKSYKLLILVQSEETKFAGQRIVVKMISKASKKIKKKKYTSLQNNISGFFMSKNVFYAKILGERIIRTFQLQKKNIHFVNEYACPDIPIIFNFEKTGDHFFLYGYNGVVLIHEREICHPLAAFQICHRKDGGILNALVDPYLRYILVIGLNNELICTKIKVSLINDKAFRNALWVYYGFKEMFNVPTIGFYPDEDITCLEMKEHEILIEESKTNAKERKQVMDEFLALKKEVITLLNQNLHGPELEKIDITEFYLHTKLKEHKEQLCEKECEWTVKYYKELIRSQTELWECMKKKFWDTQEIKRSVISSIFSNFHVENYGMIPLNPQFQFNYNYVTMFREFEEMLRAGDLFLPWVPKTSSSLQMTLEKAPIIKYKSEETRIIEALEDIDDDTPVEPKEHYPSSTASEFIEEQYFYDQEEIHTYTQNFIQKLLMNHTSILLRKMFNKHYDDMMDHKKREMDSIIEKNSRLRFILSELKNYTLHIRDPKWYPTETPENIMTVKDSEIGIRPYISPSRQAILDWEAAEAERIRLLLLADDFRERALIKMMDGVLEVRWEDTLKRDIPKPKCMLEKAPENFNEEDLRAIRDYDEKVAFLNSERQRYRNMLESEYGKVAENNRESIKKFNSKLRDLYLFKIKTETARSQHTLMRQLMQEVCFRREDLQRQEEATCVEIKNTEDLVTWIANKLVDLTEYYAECKIMSETLLNKEKTIDKNFRKEFQDYNSLIQEQSYKLFKKQPKTSYKNINIPSLLILCGTCITSGDKNNKYLTVECLEYIRSIEKIDEYIGIPTAIDENTFKVICKIRNMRFENDLRTKANQLELNDVDNAIQYFQKILTDTKEKVTSLINDLANVRNENIMIVHDKRLQIVVKRGLVEVQTTGLMADFENAIMVDRHDIEHINKIIMKAGDRKLKVMQEKMLHRRQILEKEWEHRKKKMEIQDLTEYLHMVDKVKVTKEIQRYLRQKAKGESFDKGMLTLDQEIECKKKSYEKIIADRKKSIAELDKQIKDYKKKNSVLDQKIAEINIQVCEQHELRDKEFEKNNKEIIEKRMQSIKRRSKVVKTIQDQHNEILILQTELELARLKTFPTIKFQTLDS